MTVIEPHVGVPKGLLRVLVLFHESQSLGAGTSVIRALPTLKTLGWTASAWFPGPGPLVDDLDTGLTKRFVVERPVAVSVAGWRAPPGVVARVVRTPSYFRQLRRTLEQERPHIVHANTLLSLPEALVARSCGIPLVLYVHELPPAGPKRAAAYHLAAHTADVLVGVSEAVTAMLPTAAGRTPVHTVHNGVPIPPDDLGPVDGPFVVGTVGTVSRVKGTDTFLRAARTALTQRPSLRFEHVGSPDLHRDGELDAELHGILGEHGGAPDIAMLGSRPASIAIRGWSVFVLTSRSEGFPLATLEAMALGLPVIATTAGGVPEQIEHLRTGILVRPDDHEAVATWIVRLHDDEDLRLRIGQGGRERVRADFTVARQAEGMHRAYLTALNRRFGPPVVRRRARLGA